MHILNHIEWIVTGSTALVLLAAALYLRNKLYRRKMRQQECYNALQIPCPVCNVQADLPCVGKDGGITFLHWPRVVESLRSQGQGGGRQLGQAART